MFVSATAAATLRPGQDFFPLTVDYREKFTAAGRFLCGYSKRRKTNREGNSHLPFVRTVPCARFSPRDFSMKVQVIGYLLSTDMENEGDVLMVNGASAALMISDIPWNGPIGCVRLGHD